MTPGVCGHCDIGHLEFQIPVKHSSPSGHRNLKLFSDVHLAPVYLYRYSQDLLESMCIDSKYIGVTRSKYYIQFNYRCTRAYYAPSVAHRSIFSRSCFPFALMCEGPMLSPSTWTAPSTFKLVGYWKCTDNRLSVHVLQCPWSPRTATRCN